MTELVEIEQVILAQIAQSTSRSRLQEEFDPRLHYELRPAVWVRKHVMRGTANWSLVTDLERNNGHRRVVIEAALRLPPNEIEPKLKDLLARYRLMRAHLTQSNLGLVYQRMRMNGRTRFAEVFLLAQGVRGLVVAIDRFDTATGNQLATVAYMWIRQAIQRSFETLGHPLRLPIHRQAVAWKAFKQTIAIDRGAFVARDPEVARRLWPLEQVRSSPLRTLGSESHGNVLQDSTLARRSVVSLDGEILSLVRGWFRDPGRTWTKARTSQLERARDIAMRRFGVGHAHVRADGVHQTLATIGEANGVSRERVRQILEQIRLQFTAGVGQAVRERLRRRAHLDRLPSAATISSPEDFSSGEPSES